MNEQIIQNGQAISLINKKTFKKQINRTARAVLFYNLIMFGVVFIDVVIRCIQLILKTKDEAELERAFEHLGNNMMNYADSTIAGVLIGLLFLIICFRKDIRKFQIFHRTGKMTVQKFAMLFLIFMSAQFIFSCVSLAAESGLNVIGYSIMDEIESATGGSTTLSMFLYAAFIGPAAEELVYRGIVLRSLQKYGKGLAIVVSSILFGVMHGNFLQGIFAILVGIVLSYITIEYSIKWAILLHIINNCIFGDLWIFVTRHFSEMIQQIMEWGMITGFFIGGCIVMLKHRRSICEYVRENNAPKKYYIYAFTAIWMLLFLGIEFLAGLVGIQKI